MSWGCSSTAWTKAADALRVAREVIPDLPPDVSFEVVAMSPPAPPSPWTPPSTTSSRLVLVLVAVGTGSRRATGAWWTASGTRSRHSSRWSRRCRSPRSSSVLDEGFAWALAPLREVPLPRDVHGRGHRGDRRAGFRHGLPMSAVLFYVLGGAFSAADDASTAFSGGGRSPRLAMFIVGMAPDAGAQSVERAWVRGFFDAIAPHAMGTGRRQRDGQRRRPPRAGGLRPEVRASDASRPSTTRTTCSTGTRTSSHPNGPANPRSSPRSRRGGTGGRARRAGTRARRAATTSARSGRPTARRPSSVSRAVQASGTTCPPAGSSTVALSSGSQASSTASVSGAAALEATRRTRAPLPVASVTSAQAERNSPGTPSASRVTPISAGGDGLDQLQLARGVQGPRERPHRLDHHPVHRLRGGDEHVGRPRAGHVHDEVVHGRPCAALDDVDGEDVRALGTERRGQGPEGAGPVGQHHAQQVGHGPPRPPRLPRVSRHRRGPRVRPGTRRGPGASSQADPRGGEWTITPRLPANLVEARVGAVLDLGVSRAGDATELGPTPRETTSHPTPRGARPDHRARPRRDMAAISREEVAHLARLARLAVTDEELDTFAGQLDVILQAVARVGEVAADDIPPTSHAVPLTNVLREDVMAPWPAAARRPGRRARRRGRPVPRTADPGRGAVRGECSDGTTDRADPDRRGAGRGSSPPARSPPVEVDPGPPGPHRRRRRPGCTRSCTSTPTARSRAAARGRRAPGRGEPLGPLAGRAGRGQGRHHHQGRADHLRLEDPRGLAPAVRRDDRARGCARPAWSCSARPTWTSSRWARPLSTRRTAPTRNPWDLDAHPRRLGRRLGGGASPRTRRRWPSAPTPAARSASPARSPAPSGSSRPTAARRATAWSRSRPRWTPRARAPGRCSTPRCCTR